MANRYSQEMKRILEQIETEMYGVNTVICLALIALYSKGHVLLEGNPGLGKTELVKTLAKYLDLSFGRIQFTPDLMPSDITGTELPSQMSSGEWNFKAGPIFKSLLLADEINRATPKTQAAMLEAMAETQVTVLGKTYSVPETIETSKYNTARSTRLPFMVLATQNPVDQEGTYPLPEAQADRFMFKILMPIPSYDDLGRIMSKMTTSVAENGAAFTKTKIGYDEYRKAVKDETAVYPQTEKHIKNIFFATNKRADLLQGVSKESINQINVMTKHIKFGIGPRGAAALTLGAKAWALLFEGRNEASYLSLAPITLPVLRHRIKLEYGWDTVFDSHFKEQDLKAIKQLDPDRQQDFFFRIIAEACAPSEERYHVSYAESIANIMSLRDPSWI